MAIYFPLYLVFSGHYINANLGLMPTMVYSGGYSPNSHDLILFYGTFPMKQLLGVY